MKDYQGNSKTVPGETKEPVPPKTVEKVVVGEVVVQKKTVGRKFRELVVRANFGGVLQFVMWDVIVPAAKNMFVDSVYQGAERVAYGESRGRRRYGAGGGSHYSYNNPINRNRESHEIGRGRNAPNPTLGPRSARHDADDLILSTREEAELVLERMNDIIDVYEVASVADLKDLAGLRTNHVDNKWGWVSVLDTPVRQIREGYLIELPPAEPIS